ncbi:hypothetical protein NL676_035115 [Syzygium grande]|nr:hypothetical protein NL676_035115 [Syzygium grande]
MSGRGESAAVLCGTFVVGTPEEPQEHPASQHATPLVASEAHPVSSHSSYLNATTSSSVSGFVNVNKSGGEKLDVHVAPVNASMPSGLQVIPVNASVPSGLHVVPVNAAALSGWNPINKVCNTLNQCGKSVNDAKREAETLVDNVWLHPISVTDAAIARLAQGTKMLKEGDGIRAARVGVLQGGSAAGSVELRESFSKGLVHSEMYIQVVTRDGHEFRFMGFVSYDKALKNINEALQHHRENNMAGRMQVRSVARSGK